jgi:hypothetical protein
MRCPLLPAPSAIPVNHPAKIIPRQSSLPKKTTINSRIKSTCTTVAIQPIKRKARRVKSLFIVEK